MAMFDPDPNGDVTGRPVDVSDPVNIDKRCPQGQKWDDSIQSCRSRSGSVSGVLGAPCPPGETREESSAICRCPEGQCRDINSKGCRSPRRNEKVNETDDIERDTGGGRGYCRPLDPGAIAPGGGGGGGGVGGGGGGGGFGGGGVGSNLLSMFDTQNNAIWSGLAPVMNGSQTTYSPTVVANMDAAAKRAALGQAAVGKRAVLSDAIRRGFGRSPGVSSRELAMEDRGATQSFTDATIMVRVNKAKQDFADKMQAIQVAEQHLNDLRQYVSTLDQTQAGREKAIAEIALGYARISADKAMLQQRLAADLQIAAGGNLTALEIARLGNLNNLLNQ